MTERFKLIAAAHMLVFKDGAVLLHKRMNTGYEDGNYSVPAGHHDPGEPMTRTATRELEEETGIVASEADMEFGCAMHRIQPSGRESVDYFFIVKKWTGAPENREPDRCAELAFYPLEHMPKNVIPYIREGIAASTQGRKMVQYGWDDTAA